MVARGWSPIKNRDPMVSIKLFFNKVAAIRHAERMAEEIEDSSTLDVIAYSSEGTVRTTDEVDERSIEQPAHGTTGQSI